MGRPDRTTVIRALAIVLAMLLISISAARIALADTQTWYLRSDTSGSARIMYKSGGSTSNVFIGDGSEVIWISENAASLDVGFPGSPGNDWTGQIETRTFFGSSTLTVEIGSWNGSTFDDAGGSDSDTISVTSTQTSHAFTLSPNAFTVQEGDYLALRLYNSGTFIIVYTTGNSYLTSPNSDPGYPVPDLGAIIMFAAGLGIMGWVILRFRKNRSAQPVYQEK